MALIARKYSICILLSQVNCDSVSVCSDGISSEKQVEAVEFLYKGVCFCR